MRKFTKNFLLGKHRFGSVLRKIGLSMVALLWGTLIYAQEAQSTYHVYADELTYCYQADNMYEAKVYFKDFIKIDTFVLVMRYKQAQFDYAGFALQTLSPNDPLNNGKFKVTHRTTLLGDQATGLGLTGTALTNYNNLWDFITIEWDSKNNPLSGYIQPDNAKTHVFNLKFKMDVYPLNCCGVWTAGPFCTELEWAPQISKYWNQWGQVTKILTSEYLTNGKLCVNQGIDVTNTFAAAPCNGGLGTVTTNVTPAGTYYYSYNGSSYTSSNSSSIASPSFNNTVQIATAINDKGEADPNACVSYIYTFDMPGPVALVWNKEMLTVNTRCHNGQADIEMKAWATAGTPTTYYIVPSADWAAVQTNIMNSNGNLLPNYATTQSVAQLRPGTYYIALDDGCQKLNVNNAEWSSKWKTVIVTDTNSKLLVAPVVTNLTCNGNSTGNVVLNISGAFPFKDITAPYQAYNNYNLWFNNVYRGKVKSGWDYFVNSSSTASSRKGLAAGTYRVYVCDSLGCDTTFDVTITEPAPITFLADHTDASCKTITDPGLNGTITIRSSSILGGTAPYNWKISTDPTWTNSAAIISYPSTATTATGLASGVYYIRVYDANGCYGSYVNPQTDNAVKLLTTEFTVTWPKIKCYGETTTATITLITGDGNHSLCYGMVPGSSTTVEPTTWNGASCTVKTDPNKFGSLPAGVYTFWIWDKTIGCKTSMTYEITQPPMLVAQVVPYMTVPPTCPGNTDGALTVYATGGRPWHDAKGNALYEFRMDAKTWVKSSNYNTFAIDTAPHSILVRDSAGCVQMLGFDLRNPVVNPFYWPIPYVSQLIAHRDYVNYIDFQDTIRNLCPEENINLFNKNSVNDAFYAVVANGWNWSDWYPKLGVNDPAAGGVALDLGYLKSFVWFGVPVEHFTRGAVTLNYAFWSSDSGWVMRSVQGVQQFRNPMLYITKKNPGSSPNPEDASQGWTIINHLSAYPAGVYYVVGMDEWGCVSNVDKIVILDPKKAEFVVTTKDSGCDGATDGQIRIAAYNAKYPIPFDYRGGRYQYFLSQQPQIFSRANWVNEATWYPFRDDMDIVNDSIAAINVQDGKYWIAVRDYCGVKNPKLVQVLGPFTIKGYAPMKVDWTIAKKTDITCNVWSATNTGCNTNPVDNGSIVIPENAVSGGDGTYSYQIDSLYKGQAVVVKNKWPKTGNVPLNITTLGAGQYRVTVYSKSGCQVVYPITIEEPQPLKAIINVVNASCYEDHDGILRYNITGGRHPFYEATNNIAGGAWESADKVPADRWVNVTSEEIKYRYENQCGIDNRYKFDRRVRFGTYEIFVKDSMGCIYGPIKVTVNQPAKFEMTVTPIGVSCNSTGQVGTINNGRVIVQPKGGWNKLNDNFMYTFELWKGTSIVSGKVATFDELPTVSVWEGLVGSSTEYKNAFEFTGLPIGDYVVKVYESNNLITQSLEIVTVPPSNPRIYPYGKPVTTYANYFNDSVRWRTNIAFWGTSITQPNNTFQNPDITKCFLTVSTKVTEPNPIVYDKINWNPAKCYEKPSGSIEVLNIRGGVQKKFEGYRIGLEGPVDYEWNKELPTGVKNPYITSANYGTSNAWVEKTQNGTNYIYWYATGKGTDGKINYKFENLIHGHYTVHIKDSNSCWIYKESGEIEQPDSLQIKIVVLKENAPCYGGVGKIAVRAMGGTPPYMFAADYTMLPHPESPAFPKTFDLAAYLNGLKWQAQPDSVIQVPAGVWIGYVKDANGCVTGFATDKKGNVILHHRVVVTEPTKVRGYVTGHTQPTCNDGNDGVINLGKFVLAENKVDTLQRIVAVNGGTGTKWSATVTGKDYTGKDVNVAYAPTNLLNAKGKPDTRVDRGYLLNLTGLKASTNKPWDTKPEDFTTADKYKVTIMDSNGCSWDTLIAVTQPAPFKVVLKDKQNAFICYNDKAGIYEIEVVSGGTSFGTGPDNNPLYKYKWRAFKTKADLDLGTQAAAIDSLSDETYGFTPTFLGYAGLWYRAYAMDARGCETSKDTFIVQPNKIMVDVKNVSCYEDFTNAVAGIKVTSGAADRKYQVWYQKETRKSPTETIFDPAQKWNGLLSLNKDTVIKDVFVYDNDNYTDIHYWIWVQDIKGCVSDKKDYTFDKVQHPLAVAPSIVRNECTATIKLNLTGGTPPYVVKLDGAVLTDYAAALTLNSGKHVVDVMDSRIRCTLKYEFIIDAFVPKVMEDTKTVYVGEKLDYTYPDGKKVTVGAGVYEYEYKEAGCTRKFKLTVTEICPPVVTIASVQGTGSVSPLVGKTVSLKGTITGVSQGEGFFMQDANAAWSGIWVSTTSTVGCTLGCGVEVCGAVSEVANVTTITARSFTIVASPVAVTPIIVTPSEAEVEQYESVVVKVKGARANAKDATTGEWIIYTTATNDVIVNDFIFAYTPIVGDYYNVTGVVNARLDMFKLEPRVLGDIENLKLTSVTPVSGIEYKIYPNPFNDRIFIDNNDKLTRAVITNVAGQRVIDVVSPSHEIRTSNLVSGVYVITLLNDKGIVKTEKFIKE